MSLPKADVPLAAQDPAFQAGYRFGYMLLPTLGVAAVIALWVKHERARRKARAERPS